MKINETTLPTRCEICHQSDKFNPTTNTCSRCMSLINVKRNNESASFVKSNIVLLLIGWLLYTISMFLPALPGSSGSLTYPAPGYLCAYFSFVMWLAPFEHFYLAILGICNLMMGASLFFGLLARRGGSLWFGKVMIISTILVALTPFMYHPINFIVGYYVWCASFILVTSGFFWVNKPAPSLLDDSYYNKTSYQPNV